jgi:hypothetical protein
MIVQMESVLGLVWAKKQRGLKYSPKSRHPPKNCKAHMTNTGLIKTYKNTCSHQHGIHVMKYNETNSYTSE